MSDTTERLFQFANAAKRRFFGGQEDGSLSREGQGLARRLPWPLQAVMAAGTLLSLALLSAISITAFGLLFASLAAIYLLITEVMGVPLKVDPEALLRRVQSEMQNAAPRG
jgi:hypothetical protein